MKRISKFSMALLAVAAWGAVSTKADAPLRVNGEAVTMFVHEMGGFLYDNRFGNLATAPDGHALTLAEWTKATVTASVKCLPDGTHAVLHMTGLIPKGVYTVWVIVFNGPFDPSFSTLVGVGALGANDGSQNSFQASASGEGQLSVIMPATTLLAVPYDVTDCLMDEIEVHLVGVYHFDGKTYGPGPGFPHGAAEQFGVPTGGSAHSGACGA